LKSYENDAEQALTPSGDLESAESQLEEAEAPPVETSAMISEDRIDVPEGDVLQEQEKHGWRFSLPVPSSREQLLTIIAFWGVILLGAVLRFWDLGAKPLHWDESLHAYFSMQLLHNNIENWAACLNLSLDKSGGCYRYNPLLHGPFQFHAIAFVYLISRLLGAPEHGINTTTVRIAAALLGTVIVGLPYFLRQYLGKIGAWLACFLFAVSPSMVYFSRFAREDIYMACFTLLFIVAVIQYIRTRKVSWAILAALSFVLSYATKEATFLSIAVFGSFAGALLVWEIASRRFGNLHASPETSSQVEIVQLQLFPSTEERTPTKSFLGKVPTRVVVLSAVLAYFVGIGIPALLFLNWTKNVSIYANASAENMNTAQTVVNYLKNITVGLVPWLGLLLAIGIFILLWREQSTEGQPPQRRGLARRVDPQKQRLLDTIVTMPWTHWFFALVVGWSVFLILFTALFTYMPGIGDGVWQGLFYWITQQTVERGGQPWYYYFMLVPLYEQIGLIFGLVGIVYCLVHPTRFRLFLVYWFIGNFFIYSWAGEKMPWLVIHMTLPLTLLAAVGLSPIIERLVLLAKGEKSVEPEETTEQGQSLDSAAVAVSTTRGEDEYGGIKLKSEQADASPSAAGSTTSFKLPTEAKAGLSTGGAIFGGILAILALILTLNNMYWVTYVHPADAKSEPLVYVQTTPYVNTVMDKIALLDQKYYGGRHEIPIGVAVDASWPFSWYLRDYKNVGFNCTPDNCKNYPVIISAGDALGPMYALNGPGQYTYSANYNYHEYEMRAQGNQGYMPPPCVAAPGHPCALQQYTGVGLGLWLSWGANPPPHASFDLGRTIMRVWQWWWLRIPIGRGVPSRGDLYSLDDQGAMMALFIRKDLGVAP
jgi:uncharacterized protein (TIGR03663 family)